MVPEDFYQKGETMTVTRMKLVCLHTPFMMLGKNFNSTIDIYKGDVNGVVCDYHHDARELWVYFRDQVSIIPSSNIASMILDNGKANDRGGATSALPNPYAIDNTSKLKDPMGTGRKLPDPPPQHVATTQITAEGHFPIATTPPPLSDYEAGRGDPAGAVFAGPGAVPVKAPKYTRTNK